MTIAEQKAACETYQGMTEIPTDFEAVWRGRWAKAAPAGEVLVERLPFQNAQAAYQQWSVPAPNGREIRARYIRPAREGAFPTVLMFHDLGRGVRGWHHMAHAAIGLSSTDPARLMTWGEGFGGGLAIVAASLVPGVIRCAALNPLPGDLRAMCDGAVGTDRAVLDGLDPVSFAALLTCPLLLGTGLLDQTASPKCQYAIFNRARGPKTHLVYPKYGHERINFFENELLKFFHI